MAADIRPEDKKITSFLDDIRTSIEDALVYGVDLINDGIIKPLNRFSLNAEGLNGMVNTIFGGKTEVAVVGVYGVDAAARDDTEREPALNPITDAIGRAAAAAVALASVPSSQLVATAQTASRADINELPILHVGKTTNAPSLDASSSRALPPLA